ncbi:hypothetical protein [Streptomyces sp. NK08204]|uniref:hypothetical protein n=1 Tax=Streptomyces sp. NK08204 TaxID=2873260 RepID=UPI001CED65D3|nr:hypothetical protein [Streptomyces sp. NK08204]
MNRGSFALRRGGRAIGAAALLVAGLGAGGSWPAAAAESKPCQPTAGFNHCRIFGFTGAAEDFQVPAGVEQLDFRAWGEGGDGSAFANGGAGAYVAGSLKVTPGEHLTVQVAGDYYGKPFGDAVGGKGSGTWGVKGGSSSGIRAADGSALVVAAGGGGGGVGIHGVGRAGGGGAPDGGDAAEQDLGGKGATGGQGGAAGGEGGARGADHEQGGTGGTGGTNGGGGGAGYAGGGGGAGKNAAGDAGSGGGGSSYADPGRTTDVRMLGSDTTAPPAKDDPFWDRDPEGENSPILSGIAEGGPNGPGGDGRVVLQWQGAAEQPAPELAELTRESGDHQTIAPNGLSDPLAVVARDKDGKPLADQKVTFTLEDPNNLGVKFGEGATEVTTDAQGLARSPRITTGDAEGDFTVRATSGKVATTFTAQVRKTAHTITITGGDAQRVKPGAAFAEALSVQVTASGAPAADTAVEFRVEGDAEDAPAFEGGKRTVTVTTDTSGDASAPELVAGLGTGTYTVVAAAGDATARFTLEVGAEASPSPSPSPSTSTGTGTGTGTPESSTPGTDTQGGSGSLALTGAGGIGTIAGIAAALTALGLAAKRYAGRLRGRSDAHD